jgi:geranylgeranylglycerol-phosphate geranylgeranyltransferase
MAGFAVLIGAKIGSDFFLSEGVLLAVFAAFLICGAGNTINDYFDFEIDKVNNPGRPIPSGSMSIEKAYKYSLILFALGTFFSFFINTPAFLLAAFNSALLYLYAKRIKSGGGLTKNLTVSYLVASPFLFGGLAVGNPSTTLFLVFIAFLVNASREVVKDIEDFEGDVEHLESLPVKFGFRLSGLIASTFIIASLFFSPLPFTLGMVSSAYLPFIIFADGLLIYSLASLLKSPRENAGSVQRLIKIAMVLALFGFFLGSL